RGNSGGPPLGHRRRVPLLPDRGGYTCQCAGGNVRFRVSLLTAGWIGVGSESTPTHASRVQLPAVGSHDPRAPFREVRVRKLTVGRRAVVEDEARDILADGRSHLEAMTGTSADEPDVVRFGMPIDKKVAVG